MFGCRVACSEWKDQTSDSPLTCWCWKTQESTVRNRRRWKACLQLRSSLSAHIEYRVENGRSFVALLGWCGFWKQNYHGKQKQRSLKEEGYWRQQNRWIWTADTKQYKDFKWRVIPINRSAEDALRELQTNNNMWLSIIGFIRCCRATLSGHSMPYWKMPGLRVITEFTLCGTRMSSTRQKIYFCKSRNPKPSTITW